MEANHRIEQPPRLESARARLKRWLSLQAYGLFVSTLFGARTSPLRMRARFERWAVVPRDVMQRKHRRLTFEDHHTAGVHIERVSAVESPSRVILHLHGGGFFMGSSSSYRNRAMRLSYRASAEVFVPDYHLAPEHPYPAALDDALDAWEYIQKLRPNTPVFVTGDSAGGGLALSLMVRLRQLGRKQPDGAILLSPWTDLTGSGASVETNAGKDLWFTRSHFDHWAAYYAGGTNLRSPLLSPIFADLSDLPPLLVLAAEDELLLDDARRVVDSAQRSGTDARLLVGRGMQHDWPLTLPWLDESRHAWQKMIDFIEERTQAFEHRTRSSVTPRRSEQLDSSPQRRSPHQQSDLI